MVKTVILANGEFPKKGTAARELLESAGRVVCCDGAANQFRRAVGRDADFTVGDCDSIQGSVPRVTRIAEQDTNDLAKAIRFCRQHGWNRPIVLGATGKRDDHTLGNVFLAMECGLEIVTSSGRFLPVVRRLRIKVGKGSPVSVFAAPGTRMTSHGLAWPLDGVKFESFHCATLNRASADTVVIESTFPAYVYIVK